MKELIELAEAIVDLKTHRDSWIAGLELAKENAHPDNKSYREHEIRAFARTFKILLGK